MLWALRCLSCWSSPLPPSPYLLHASCRVHNAWSGTSWQPWMRPLLKLKLLLLSKLLWDARQNPDFLAGKEFQVRWPAKALHRAGKQMFSPCMAGDLLQQRAPGLYQPVHSFKQLSPSTRDGLSLHAAGYVRGMSPSHLAYGLNNISCYLAAAASSGHRLLGEHPRDEANTNDIPPTVAMRLMSAIFFPCMAAEHAAPAWATVLAYIRLRACHEYRSAALLHHITYVAAVCLHALQQYMNTCS